MTGWAMLTRFSASSDLKVHGSDIPIAYTGLHGTGPPFRQH